MTATVADLLARRRALVAAAPAPATPKPHWRITGFADVFEEQHCTSCGAVATIHLGRFVVMLDDTGARRLTRHAVVPEGTTPTRDVWHTTAPTCMRCWHE